MGEDYSYSGYSLDTKTSINATHTHKENQTNLASENIYMKNLNKKYEI